MNQIFWLSFASDGGFRGAIVTEAANEKAALEKIKHINPGGEIMIMPCPDGVDDVPYDRDRLLTAQELQSCGDLAMRDLPGEERAKFLEMVTTVICEECNPNSASNRVVGN